MTSTSPATPPQRDGHHSAALDGLRAVAVVGVVAVHLGGRPLIAGRLGVDVFFVLSGFLITSLLLTERVRTGGVAFGAFYARRALRLFPALAAVVVATIALHALFADEPLRHNTLVNGSWSSVLYVASWMQASGRDLGGFGHTWSLSVEEHFYLLWPLVVAAVRPSRLRVVAIGLFAASALEYAWAIRAGWDVSALGYRPDMRAHQLLAGCALATLLPALTSLSRRAWDAALAGSLAVLALLAVTFLWVTEHLINAGPVPVILGPLVAIVVGHVWLFGESPLARMLSHPVMEWIGRRSYGIYLIHVPIVTLLLRSTDALPRRVVVILVTVPLTLALSAASYRWIEQPFLRRQARFRRAALTPGADPPVPRAG